MSPPRASLRRVVAAWASAMVVLPAAVAVLGVPSARGQDDLASARLTLRAQTPWNTLADPALRLAVRAENTGEAVLDDLSLGITIGSAIRSRSAYDASLTDGPDLPIYANTFAQAGAIAPGRARVFRLRVDLSELDGISTGDSLVYPMRVDLRSASASLASLDTPAIVLVRTPERPVLVSWSTELTAPIALGPDGRLADDVFESAIAPGGALAQQVRSLELVARPDGDPFQLVIQPSLLDQLTRMRDGYERVDGTVVTADDGGARDAAALLSAIGRVAAPGGPLVTALPFAGATMPSLIASGLRNDADVQLDVGEQVVGSLLDVRPSSTIVRPTAGALSEPALEVMADRGADVILANPDTTDREPAPNGYAPLPTTTLAAGARTVAAVLPDPATQELLASGDFDGDPVRRAQAMLGELAAIWREAPVPDLPRGIALTLPAGASPGFWGPFVRRLVRAPFLQAVTPDELVSLVPPPADPATLAAPSTASFSTGYATAIKAERRDVRAYASMLPADDPSPARLSRDLLYAEAAEYLGDELEGRAWIDRVNRITEDAFGRARPDTSQVFTFTSRTGSIPILMSDPGATPLTVVLQLRSAQFRFPDGDERTVTLTEPNQIVSFSAAATTSGRSQILVVVRAPSGRKIQQQILVVRTTAVSRIALMITIAAAVVLAGLWARRYVRRPKTTS
jgi:hypothetical protein